MTWGRRRAHNDVTMSIGFNPAFNLGQLWISQQFLPAPQVKRGLRLLLWKFDRERRHNITVSLRQLCRQGGLLNPVQLK